MNATFPYWSRNIFETLQILIYVKKNQSYLFILQHSTNVDYEYSSVHALQNSSPKFTHTIALNCTNIFKKTPYRNILYSQRSMCNPFTVHTSTTSSLNKTHRHKVWFPSICHHRSLSTTLQSTMMLLKSCTCNLSYRADGTNDPTGITARIHQNA